MDEFLHSGEKIKHLRMTLGLQQEDLTNDKLSKSLISMIERNIRNLTWYTAEIIAEALNKYYKNIGQEITAEYLMETAISKVENTIKNNIRNLNNALKYGNVDESLFLNTYEKSFELAKKWGLEKEIIQLKKAKGDYYFYFHQYKDALNMYLDVFHYEIKIGDHQQVADLYIRLGAIYQQQLQIDLAIPYFEKAVAVAQEHNTANEEEIKMQSIYHHIVCYRKISRHDIALTLIGQFKEGKWKEKLYKKYYHKILLMEANTYRDVTNYSRASRIYSQMMEQKDDVDKDTLFLVYKEYATHHLQRGKVERALVYIRKAVELKSIVDSKYLPSLYLQHANCYMALEEYDKVSNLLDYGLTLAQWVSKPQMIVEINFAFSRLHMKLGDYKKAKNYIKEAEGIIKQEGFTTMLKELYSYYIELHSPPETWENIKEYTMKLRMINK